MLMISIFVNIFISVVTIIAIKNYKSYYNQLMVLEEQYKELSVKKEDETLRGKISSEKDLNSSATIYSTIIFQQVEYPVEIPARLKERSIDGNLLRFDLDLKKISNSPPFNIHGFHSIMNYKLNHWYNSNSQLITWISEDFLNLSEMERKELKYLIEFSNELSDENKNKIIEKIIS